MSGADDQRGGPLMSGADDQRRIEKMGTAGDALAAALGKMKPGRDQPTADAMDALDAWRSVRGDAPTQPPAAGVSVPQKSTKSPAGDTAAPDGMSLDRFAAMPREQAREWIEERSAEHRRQREAECDANGRHLVLEADTSHCGHCGRLYADIAGGSAPASTDGDQR